MEEQHEPVRSTVSLSVWSVAGGVLDEEVVAGYMQKAAMRAVLHSLMIKAMPDTLLMNNGLMAPIAIFVSK